MGDLDANNASNFYWFEAGMTKHIAGLAAFVVTVGGLAWNNHFVLFGLWIVALGGVIWTLAYCVSYKRASRAARTVILGTASAVLLGTAAGATYFLQTHPDSAGTSASHAHAGSQSEDHPSNSSATSGDNAPAVAGNGNTVNYSASQEPSTTPHKRKR